MTQASQNWRIFLRHAHRDLFDRSLDNGLSEKGRRQGTEIQDWFREQGFNPERVFSSPKLRCLETAGFVAELFQLEVEVLAALDEHHPGETESEFLSRLQAFLRSDTCPERSVFCSHGDVIPVIAHLLGEPGIQISKGDVLVSVDGRVTAVNPIRG